MAKPDHVLVADWGKDVAKRVVYRVDTAARVVTHVEPPEAGWTVERLVAAGTRLSGSVLVLIDVAIGVPRGLFDALRRAGHRGARNMAELLRACAWAETAGDARRHEEWSVARPYIHVPKGRGALTRFAEVASRHGVRLHRAIDREAGGRSPLVLSGIPGTVGSGSRDVLHGLGALDPKNVGIWPFDGSLAELHARGRIAVGETYPRALYAHALLDERAGERPLLSVGKSKPPIRAAALDRLATLAWHRAMRVALAPEHVGRARANEDEFDAYLSALAVLRLVLEGVSLEDESLRARSHEGLPVLDDVAEGGILGLFAWQCAKPQRGPRVMSRPPSRDLDVVTP